MERLYGLGGVVLFVIGLVLAYLDLTALRYSYIGICWGCFSSLMLSNIYSKVPHCYKIAAPSRMPVKQSC